MQYKASWKTRERKGHLFRPPEKCLEYLDKIPAPPPWNEREVEKASTVKCFHFLPFLSQVSSVGMCTYVQKIYNFSPWLMLVAQCEIWERTRPMLELLLLLLRHMLKSAIYNQVEGERRILITPFRGAPQARVQHHTLSTPLEPLSRFTMRHTLWLKSTDFS